MSAGKKLVCLAAAVLMSMGFSVGARAAVFFTATFKGTVGSVLDINNAFGGGDLDGSAFTATVSATIPNWMFCGCSTEIFDGGAPPWKPIDATLTINGFTQNFTSTFLGLFALANDDPFDGNLVGGLVVAGPETWIDIAVQNFDPSSPILDSNFLTPATYHVLPTDDALGFFSLDADVYGDLFVETVDVTSVTTGALPEPGTWAMMIVGFGVMGAGIRMRRGRIALLAIN